MQKVILIGNLTGDCEVVSVGKRYVCKFTVAVSRPYADENGKKQTDFFNCEYWKSNEPAVAQYLTRGVKVFVGGSIYINSYQSNDGSKRTNIKVNVAEIELLSRATSTDKSNKNDLEELARGTVTPFDTRPKQQSFNGFDDDIPF